MERLRAIERNFIFHLRTHCRALSLAVVVLPFVVLASIVAFSRLSTTPPYVGPDALVFEYSGWLIVNGRVPYLDLWDIKPPGIHYVAGGLAAVFGFSQGLFHTSSVIVTMSVSLSVIILVWQLVAQSTNDYIAAAIAGTATLAFKTTYVLPSVGLRPKFYVLLFGLLSVHFLVVKKHTRAVVSASLACVFWQLGIVFLITSLGVVVRERRELFFRSLGFVAAIAILSIIPVAVRGGLVSMVFEVGFAPFISSDGVSVVDRLRDIYEFAGLAPILSVGGGAFGILVSTYYRRRIGIVLAPIVVFYILQVIALDYDGTTDALPLVIITAVGLGLLASDMPQSAYPISKPSGRAVLLVIFVLTTAIYSPIIAPGTADNSSPEQVSELEYLFWSESFSDKCHLRKSIPEQTWVEAVKQIGEQSDCEYKFWSIIKIL